MEHRLLPRAARALISFSMARFQNTDITNKDNVETIALKLKQRLEDQVLPVVEVIAPVLPLVPLVALIPNLSNVSAQVDGTGTDYALTAAYAAVIFGTTSPAIVLPTAGTYLILANVSFKDALVLNDLHAKIRDVTHGADVGAEKIVTVAGASGARRTNLVLNELLTVTEPTSVRLFAYNATSVSGSAESTTTNIQYVKLT